MRAHWMLLELGLEYESRPIQARSGETHTEEFKRLNPGRPNFPPFSMSLAAAGRDSVLQPQVRAASSARASRTRGACSPV